jgi:hypothetical protein
LHVRDACRVRAIPRIGAMTPLLVPSFSSRGFPDIAVIHELTKPYLVGVSLISAYDLHHGILREADAYATDLLFLDSGGYEARVLADPLDPYADGRAGLAWTADAYDGVLENLQPLADVVIVGFDHGAPRPLAEQAQQARTLFAAHPALAGDFLAKPTAADTGFVDIDDLVAQIDEVAGFDLVGLTEKELGPTLLDRCRNLLRVRGAFSARGWDTPIHVFGCLDPATMLAYFLCGADVFDGLAWLRFAYRDGVPISHAAGIVAGGTWAARDEDVVMLHRVQNLARLKEQQDAMRSFCCRYAFSDLSAAPDLVGRVIPLVREAGLIMEE